MLIAVVGSSGLGRVAGVPSSSPAALLRVVADRPDSEVVVLCPEHLRASTQQQADLVAAARPAARVSVIATAHHALTLTVVADRVLTTNPWLTGVDELSRMLRTELSAARSLVWSPSAWRLRGVGLGVGARIRCLVGGPSPIVEVAPRREGARDGWRAAADDRLFTAAALPAQLADQLGDSVPRQVDTMIIDSCYAGRSTRLLTALRVRADHDSTSHRPAAPPAPDTPIDRPRSAVVTSESEAA